MGMDVYGRNGTYFRANIWSWRAICYAMELSGFIVPGDWHSNNGAGYDKQKECDALADRLNTFLSGWDGEVLVLPASGVAVDKSGRFVDPGTPDSRSPYAADRAHIEEFVEFLGGCGGFQIH